MARELHPGLLRPVEDDLAALRITMAPPSSRFAYTPITGPGAHSVVSAEFYRREEIANLHSAAGDLNTEPHNIHPAFSKEKLLWVMSDHCYDHFKEIFALATLFLEELLPMFWVILCTTPTFLGTAKRTNKPLFQFIDPPQTLTPQQAEDARKALTLVVQTLAYGMSDPTDPCARAMTFANLNEPHVLGGTSARIHLIFSLVERLYGMYCRNNDLIQRQFAAFEFARTLAHEVVHVACRAVSPANSRMFLLGSRADVSTEEGFEAEKFLFGGVFVGLGLEGLSACGYADIDQGVMSTQHEMLTLVDWPCPARLAHYNTIGAPVVTRQPLPLDRVTCRWPLSFLEVSRLFSRAFWADPNRSLKFARVAGYRWGLWDNDGGRLNFGPLHGSAEDGYGVPVGYYGDHTGMIRPLPVGHAAGGIGSISLPLRPAGGPGPLY